MKKWIITGVIVLLVGWAVFDFITEESDSSETGLGFDDMAPDFTLKTLDDEEIKLSDLRGEPVMINFWATWCPPCKAEMPDMQKFYEETGMHVIAVNVTDSERSKANVPKFVDELELTFPVLLDEDGDVSELYEAFQLPTTYFLDKDGSIYFKLAGPMNYDFMMDKYKELH